MVVVLTLVFSLALGCLLVHADIFDDDLLSSFLELYSSCATQVGQKSMFPLPIVRKPWPLNDIFTMANAVTLLAFYYGSMTKGVDVMDFITVSGFC